MQTLKRAQNVFLSLVLLCGSFYGCNTTEPIRATKKTISPAELVSSVRAMPEYQSMVELMRQHHKHLESTLSDLPAIQNAELKSLFTRYTDAKDLKANGTKQENDLFNVVAVSIFSPQLNNKNSALLNILSETYEVDYQALADMILQDLYSIVRQEGRIKMDCIEVYNKVYWAQVDYWYTFSEQNECFMSAEQIDELASDAATWAYIGCVMAGL